MQILNNNYDDFGENNSNNNNINNIKLLDQVIESRNLIFGKNNDVFMDQEKFEKCCEKWHGYLYI